jgi:hypothetical protein
LQRLLQRRKTLTLGIWAAGCSLTAAAISVEPVRMLSQGRLARSCVRAASAMSLYHVQSSSSRTVTQVSREVLSAHSGGVERQRQEMRSRDYAWNTKGCLSLLSWFAFAYTRVHRGRRLLFFTVRFDFGIVGGNERFPPGFGNGNDPTASDWLDAS